MRKSHAKIWQRWNRFLKGERTINTDSIPSFQEPEHISDTMHQGNNEYYIHKIKEAICSCLVSIQNSILETINSVKQDLLKYELKIDGLSKEEIFDIINLNKNQTQVQINIMGIIFKKIMNSLSCDYKSFASNEIIKHNLKSQVEKIDKFNIDTTSVTLSINTRLHLNFKITDQQLIDIPKGMVQSDPSKKKEITPISLTMKMVKAEFTEENWQLYKSYVNAVHDKGKDEDDKKGYQRWLCSENLHYEDKVSKINSEKILKMGAYHMNYYLDEQLIGVGVIDVLDHGMSTVYFFFDPKLKPLKFGIVSALYEIDWIKKHNLDFPDFKYYYLGFWIHNCDKMNYKSDYEPTYLLCPKTQVFLLLDDQLKGRIQSGKITLLDKADSQDDNLWELDYVKQQVEELKLQEFSDDEKKRMMQFLVNGKLKVDDRTLSFQQLNKPFFMQIKGLFEGLWIEMGLENFKNLVFTL